MVQVFAVAIIAAPGWFHTICDLSEVLSVHKGANAAGSEPAITVNTVVHVKNWLGRFYSLPVAPAHRLIARAMVRAVGQPV